MEQLKSMKETLVGCVQSQLCHLDTVDAKELGEVVDMIKDLEEAMYYCTIIKSMEEKEKEGNKYEKEIEHHYYTDDKYRDMDKKMGKMYYPYPYDYNYPMYYNGKNDKMVHHEEMPLELMRDSREGRSPMSRKNYMEAKEMHHDKAVQLKELEKYMQELSKDITEMIHDASPEEKQMLQQRIQTLASKIQ